MNVVSFATCLLIAGTGTALAQAALAQAAPAERPILDCADFSKKTDEAELIKRFGKENVVRGKLDGAEGETVPGTIVYPKDPARRLEISWWDTGKRRGLAGITVKDRSAWLVRTPGAARPTIGLGAGLDEVGAANEKPFQINGFGWDYGGYGMGWKGGRLDRMAGGCSLSARFNPDPKVKGKALDRVSGEKEFGSSDPALRAVKPSLSSITIGWPEK
ncbi:hypothetical protein SAMN02799631_02717 [Methylobacterium sp. 174MFSha1.1]|uniref:hypothetical protein n=1 Tax=Methylobacterium sp. 174MFSha1.1 TaxID=1502749 RepID=UPI0008F0FD49|nr:hypothetical protein [Methylobacterium sp. 174MFSha1.1]SFU85515.1 hypothetical protein SAMN02799631_02717 [Methylobacterium sp. 174MFSha1.1]